MADSLRLDKFLWFAAIVAKRARCASGRGCALRRARSTVHCPVRVGDVLSFAPSRPVRVLKVEALPAAAVRRRSAGAYTELRRAAPLTSEGGGD
jgi:ribosome-associated heat shock protein Hsp15